MINKLISKYNSPNTLLVFSSYALKDNDLKKQNALSWYTKELLSLFPKKQRIVILAEKNYGENTDFIENKNILIIPSWQKKDFNSLFTLIKYFSLFNKAKKVMFQFEFNIFGNLFGPIISLILLFYLKINNKKIYFQLHQVVSSLKTIRNQINIGNEILLNLFDKGLTSFYTTIGWLSEKVIVTENVLAKRLTKYIDKKKIVVLPILVAKKKRVFDKNNLDNKYKNLKSKRIILFFGYLSWYKGIDWLIDAFSKISEKNPKTILVIAGDKSPTLSGKTHYENFYQRLKNSMKKKKNIIHTGFIDNNELRYIINKSSVLIFPYRAFISSSGPLSWALSYKKPIILSKQLKEYKKSPDFKMAMEKNQIKDEEIFFELKTDSLMNILNNIQLKKLYGFSKTLNNLRSKNKIKDILINTILKDKETGFAFRLKSSLKLLNLVRFMYAK